MSFSRYVTQRLLWTLFATFLMLSVTFLVYAVMPDPTVEFIRWAAPMESQEEAVQAYRESRNYDDPILDRYLKWMWSYVTLEWGYSFTYNEPVMDILARKAPVTLVYLIPSIVMASLASVGLGLSAALNRDGMIDILTSGLAYIGFGIPAFFLGELFVFLLLKQLNLFVVAIDSRYGLWTLENITGLLLPIPVVTLNLLAVQIRYVRSEALGTLSEDFVKMLRSTGAGPRQVGRAVLRNIAVPLLSVFFTEVLTVLFVTVYIVEVVFNVPGLGLTAYQAIADRDIGLILATTFIPVLVGLFGNLFQDIAFTIIDPRIYYSRG
ncbi:MAG: ABC transporter permease [Halolamina sp.]|uniref:ABC transporter permease n=1 Tax=Halolamina sp. TaxID=1940283 RepID=UPI002FC3A4C2